MHNMARAFIILGILLILAGIVLQFAPWLLSWFGHLPGDICVESENARVYIPISSIKFAPKILLWNFHSVATDWLVEDSCKCVCGRWQTVH